MSIKSEKQKSLSHVRAEALKKATCYYFVKKRYSCALELGLDKRGRLRADVLAMTIHGYLVLIEVKQSLADFRQDKKWEKYIPYANKMYFALLPDVWDKLKGTGKIPSGIGVLVLSETTGRMRVAQKAQHRELERGVQKKIVCRMAYRGGAYSPYNTTRTQRVFLPKGE